MKKPATSPDSIPWQDRARRLATLLNPVVAPLEVVTALHALGPSLMPHTSTLQGLAMGLSVLGSRATTDAVERLTRMAVPIDAPLARRLLARAAVGSAGALLAARRERSDGRLWVAALRAIGLQLRAGAAGGVLYDVGRHLEQRHPARRAIEPLAVSAAMTSGLLWWAGRQFAAREAAVAHWPLPQPSKLPGALATSYVVTVIGTDLGRGFLRTRSALESYLGPGASKNAVARLANLGLWTAGVTAAYNLGVAYVGRANEKIEPGYASPPTNPLVSGSPESLLPFGDLGQQGRRYVTDVITPELIEQVMGEEAVAQPIRTYVGFNSEPLYPTARAELALAELARTGAFDRSLLLLVSPTGTGWVNHTLCQRRLKSDPLAAGEN